MGANLPACSGQIPGCGGMRRNMITILVVEDEIYARRSLIGQIERYASPEQFRILEAGNGEQGLQIYREENPDLVLTDIRMPKMDGLALLKAIRVTDTDTMVIMVSAYTDFEYAITALKQGAVDYLLKPIEDEKLKDCLDKCLNRSRTRKREHIITGQDVAARYARRVIQDGAYGDYVGKSVFHKTFPSYRVLNLWFPNMRTLEWEQLYEKMEEVFQEDRPFRLLPNPEKVWTLIMGSGREDTFVPRRILRALSEEGYEGYLSIGGKHAEPGEVRNAYQESLHALKYKILTEERILWEEKLNEDERTNFVWQPGQEAMLQEALRDRNPDKLRNAISRIFQSVRRCEKIKMESLELLFSRITLRFRELIQETGSLEIRMREGSTGILDFNGLEDMERFLIKIGSNICEMMDAGQGRDPVDIVSEYVAAHYDQDVTIKEIAEKVLFMNPAYVSHVFAEKKGISFSAWLKQLRINHARELLEGGSLSVTEVASLSGYNDTSQFIRLFKQETGMTPGKYREKYMNGCR